MTAVGHRGLSARGAGWAVATPHSGASDAAARAFEQGGNAVDAALAAAVMLTVAYPHQCSVGGDLLALVGSPDGSVAFVNASGRAPRAVDADDIARRESAMPVDGALAVTVPGAVSGWHALHQGWGTLPWSSVFDEPEAAAREGLVVSGGLGRDLRHEQERLSSDAGMREVFFDGDRVLAAGRTLRQPRLARSLATLASDGPSALYGGPLGAAIVRVLSERGSSMTLGDLTDHRADRGAALGAVYDGIEYLSSGANSQGTFFLSGLRTLEVVRSDQGPVDPLGADAGLVASVLSAAAADRDLLLADPEHADLPVEWLLSGERASDLASRVRRGPATRTAPAPPASGDTVAVVTADRHGTWVSLIQSLFHSFGAGILDPATGIVLHNRGASFSLDPSSPNRLSGAKRPLHTLMPVLVRRDGTLVGAHGAMGGRAQPQVHTHLALRLAAGATPEVAVSSPRWVVGAMEAGASSGSGLVSAEVDVPEAALRSLRAAGMAIESLPRLDDGVGHAQIVRSASGEGSGGLACATDPRADGAALAGPTR